MQLSRNLSKIHTVVDATRSALANPEDTTQAFRIADALAFRTPWKLMERFRATPVGNRLLDEKPNIVDALGDRSALLATPQNSLARAYLAFIDGEGISADGLVAASEYRADRAYDDPDVDWVQCRMRDTHDLWHTVTGYRGDLLGETALLAFTYAQTGHVGIGFLAGIGLAVTRDRGFRRMLAQGYMRGRRAEWLPAQDWEALLPMGVDEVRRQLGIDMVPVYEPVRELPATWLH